MTEPLQGLGEHIKQATAGAAIAATVRLDELMLDTTPDKLIALLTFLRDDPRCLFKQLVDVCGVDWPEREKRFDVVYNLLSLKNNQRVRVKVATDEATPVPSAAAVFSSAAGSSARPTISTASRSWAIPTCGASSPTTASRAIRCARISR